MSLSLGVDLGGTALRACLFDPESRRLRRERLPSVPPAGLAGALATLLRRWRAGRLERLTAGSTGVWSPAQRRSLERSLRPLARRVRALSDLELAHAAAFAGGPGVLVVAGTGSGALGRGVDGRVERAGGLGPLLGDEGSAFWLGRRALKDPRLSRRMPGGLALRLAHDPAPVRSIAALAKPLLRWARRDKAARALRREAAELLAGLAAGLSEELRLPRPVPVSWRGGMFLDDGLREDFRAALRRRGRFDARPPLLEPEVAGAVLFSTI